MRLIDADGLIRDAKTLFCPDGYKLSFIRLIESTKTVEEITNDDVQQAIKEGFANGYEMAKEKFSPKKGEWIDTGDMEEYWSEEYQCSICGAKDHWHNFCPNCGAKMQEGRAE